jgi:hypothetical protein
MKRVVMTALGMLTLAGCATTYHNPVEERSRAYAADLDMVWQAALAAVDDAKLALTETAKEHGRIRARAGGSIWDLKGHVLLVVVTDLGDGRVRVDANAEGFSDDTIVDFGRAAGIVRDYLAALDHQVLDERGG